MICVITGSRGSREPEGTDANPLLYYGLCAKISDYLSPPFVFSVYVLSTRVVSTPDRASERATGSWLAVQRV